MSNRRWQTIQIAANTYNDCIDCTQMTVIMQLQYSPIMILKDQWLINQCISIVQEIMVSHFLWDFDCILSTPFWILDGFWVHLLYHADGFWVVWSIFVMGEKKRHACMHQLTMISYLYSMLTANIHDNYCIHFVKHEFLQFATSVQDNWKVSENQF